MEFLASSLDSDNHLPSKDNFRLKLTYVRICHGRLQHCFSFKKKKKEIETKPIEFARKRVKEREKRRSIERRVNFSLRTHREPREGGVGVAAPRWEAVVESKAEDRTFTGKFRAFLCAAPRVPKFSAPAANCCLDRYRVYDKPPRAPIGAGRN